ncbi:MAG: glutaredoxin 3 [Rickettsiaceae bacterium]|nr:glutaredoxin 3 [Rickettsiaceae bacterium]MDP4832582.1 glutaredoxin 3 [Rickettsiaceae bacterium]MDP5020572.1 glutaredoxin 3 [Rickettsiaceae bacterium]MDP5083243.1 glutaredoxin 3 [Rickettsiaceae bacterium]
MKKILIYTTLVCPYCVRAKALLKRKGFIYEEINANDDKIRDEMIKKSGGMRTVPQIFIGDQHIGGCDELYALEKDGKLDQMVK